MRATTIECRLLRKHGEPLLLMSQPRRVARVALDLYPAQSSKARFARRLLGWSLASGLSLGTEPVRLQLDPQDVFTRFLWPQPTNYADLNFAMLCGNPNVAGRRCILLLLDTEGHPQKIVKAGIGSTAKELIRHEALFLAARPDNFPHAAKLLERFNHERTEAIALEYVIGETPKSDDSLGEVMSVWLQRDRTVRFDDLEAARRLFGNSGTNPALRTIWSQLNGVQLHPAIFHGDFAPWNIRVDAVTKKWTALDWERGEAIGPPAWDWFHFVIQKEILVCHSPTKRLVDCVEHLLDSDKFTAYANAAGIQTIVRPWLLAYLLYCVEVLRPTDGLQATKELFSQLLAKWSVKTG